MPCDIDNPFPRSQEFSGKLTTRRGERTESFHVK
jgi:hypothetical protein